MSSPTSTFTHPLPFASTSTAISTAPAGAAAYPRASTAGLSITYLNPTTPLLLTSGSTTTRPPSVGEDSTGIDFPSTPAPGLPTKTVISVSTPVPTSQPFSSTSSPPLSSSSHAPSSTGLTSPPVSSYTRTETTSESTSKTAAPPPIKNGSEAPISSTAVTSTYTSTIMSSSESITTPTISTAPSPSSLPPTRPTVTGSPTSTITRTTSTSTRPLGESTTPRAPSTTITSVTVITTHSQGTTSTTLTVHPEFTLSTPLAVVLTSDGSLVTSTPPFVTVYSTRTEANGSLATETHIVANPHDVASLDGASNRGVLGKAGAAAGIFATVGVLATAMCFIVFLLWRRRRQANMRKRWLTGMRQQRPDSLGGHPFGRDDQRSGGGNGDGGSPGLGFGGSESDSLRLPWDETRRIPAQRAETREYAGFGAGGSTGLAGIGSGLYHERGASGKHNDVAQSGGIRENFMQDANSRNVNKNPTPGGIFHLTRSGSASTTSSATSNQRNTQPSQPPDGRTGSIDKRFIGNPIPSPIRKPAIYRNEDPFSDRAGLGPITERASIALTASSGQKAKIGPPLSSPNWLHRQGVQPAHSPAPSTPSMYPPTLPADDELDDTDGFESDATLERTLVQSQSKAPSAVQHERKENRPAYGETEGYSASQNLFVTSSRPRPVGPLSPPAAARVPPLSINTSVNSLGAKGNGAGSSAPPRPPRSILRTSSGSLSFSPKATHLSAEFVPLTPPASSPGHSSNSSWPNSSRNRSGSLNKNQTLASPAPAPPVQDRVQEILANRRILLDVRRRSAESNSS